MRKLREVLRLKHERGLSHRAIAQACAIGLGTVTLYLRRTAQSGLGWPLPADLDDAGLEARLFRRPAPAPNRARPDCAHIHGELKRNGVTLQLLWEEYLQVHPSGYRYTGNGKQKRDPYGHVKRDPRGWRVNTSILLRRSEAGHGSPTAGNPPSPPPPIRTASRRFRPDAGAPWPPVRRRGRPGRPRPGRAARPIAAA